jgi:hypothetical protein
MPISFITTSTRPDTTVDFYHNQSSPKMVATAAAIQVLEDAGSITRSRVTSDDNLTTTNTVTCADLATLNAYYNIIADVELGLEYITFANANQNIKVTRSLTGIDSAFTMTTTYTLGEDKNADVFASIISSIPHVGDIQINPGNIVVVKNNYSNSAEWSAGHYNDAPFSKGLVEGDKIVSKTTEFSV